MSWIDQELARMVPHVEPRPKPPRRTTFVRTVLLEDSSGALSDFASAIFRSMPGVSRLTVEEPGNGYTYVRVHLEGNIDETGARVGFSKLSHLDLPGITVCQFVLPGRIQTMNISIGYSKVKDKMVPPGVPARQGIADVKPYKVRVADEIFGWFCTQTDAHSIVDIGRRPSPGHAFAVVLRHHSGGWNKFVFETRDDVILDGARVWLLGDGTVTGKAPEVKINAEREMPFISYMVADHTGYLDKVHARAVEAAMLGLGPGTGGGPFAVDHKVSRDLERGVAALAAMYGPDFEGKAADALLRSKAAGADLDVVGECLEIPRSGGEPDESYRDRLVHRDSKCVGCGASPNLIWEPNDASRKWCLSCWKERDTKPFYTRKGEADALDREGRRRERERAIAALIAACPADMDPIGWRAAVLLDVERPSKERHPPPVGGAGEADAIAECIRLGLRNNAGTYAMAYRRALAPVPGPPDGPWLGRRSARARSR